MNVFIYHFYDSDFIFRLITSFVYNIIITSIHYYVINTLHRIKYLGIIEIVIIIKCAQDNGCLFTIQM